MAKKWSTLQIPRNLYEEIKEMIKENKEYINTSEFVRDTLRHKLEELKEKDKED